jgi:hypothetical protein
MAQIFIDLESRTFSAAVIPKFDCPRDGYSLCQALMYPVILGIFGAW